MTLALSGQLICKPGWAAFNTWPSESTLDVTKLDRCYPQTEPCTSKVQLSNPYHDHRTPHHQNPVPSSPALDRPTPPHHRLSPSGSLKKLRVNRLIQASTQLRHYVSPYRTAYGRTKRNSRNRLMPKSGRPPCDHLGPANFESYRYFLN